jgi:prepilin-type N-terminal cleavage/methylation domain-containing protein
MLNKIKKSQSEGFTIIEVVIVMAIAALILLIVLLAVPALQRNSRNTAIKNDASAIVGGVSEFSNNNDGRVPNAAGSAQNGSRVTLNTTAVAGLAPSEAKVQSATTVTFAALPTDSSQVVVRFGQKCTASNSFALTANTRSTAVLYFVEPNTGAPGAAQQRCIDS